MAWGQEREATRVDDPQATDPTDSGLRVQHRYGIIGRSHFARGSRVPQLDRALTYVPQDLLVRADIAVTREVFFAYGHAGHRLPDHADPLESSDGHLRVDGMGEVVRVNDGRVLHAGAPDRDVAGGKRSAACGGDGPVVEAVGGVRIGVVPVVAVEAVLHQVFHLRPIGGELRVKSRSRRFADGAQGELLKSNVRRAAGQGTGGFRQEILVRLNGVSRVVQEFRRCLHVDSVGDSGVRMVLQILAYPR